MNTSCFLVQPVLRAMVAGVCDLRRALGDWAESCLVPIRDVNEFGQA